jgi:enoyl-CoA hydratase/carnithine racemase
MALPTTWGGERLTHQVVDGVLSVELHADPLNEIGLGMLVELERVARLIREGAGGARTVVFSSAVDKGFSAGADLWELHAGLRSVEGGAGPDAWLEHARRLFDGPRTASRAGAAAVLGALRTARDWRRAAKVWGVRAFLDRIHAVFDTFDTAPIPTVAAVHGVCFGGGFELALTCDVIVADKSARFAFPELRLGLIPGFGGIPRLERDLGNAAVRDLLMSGRSLGAKRAHEVGLVAQLVGAGHASRSAHRLAQQMTRFDARTTRVAKRFAKPFPARRLAEEKALFCELLTSPVVEEALAAFVASDDALPYLPTRPRHA